MNSSPAAKCLTLYYPAVEAEPVTPVKTDPCTADAAVANRNDKCSFPDLHRTRVVLYAYRNSLICFVEIPEWFFSQLKEQRCVK